MISSGSWDSAPHLAVQWTVERSSRPNGDSNPSTRSDTDSNRRRVSALSAGKMRVLQRLRHQSKLSVWSIATIDVAEHEMFLDSLQHMPQVFGEWSVGALREPHVQWLPCGLHEVHEFACFQQRDERILRDRIPCTSDSNPDSISSIRLLPRQCLLVGKLTM